MRNPISIVNLPTKKYGLKTRIKRKLRGQTLIQHGFDENRCIFVHIPKTAGTSLKNILFPADISLTHHLAMDYYLDSPLKFGRYFVFAFVRNPFDRLVSAYNYLMQGGKNRFDKDFRDTYLCNYSSFEDLLRHGLSRSEISNYYHFLPQHLFLVNSRGKVIVDFIGRFENIETDFEKIVRILGVERQLPHRNKSYGDPYQKYYSEELREMAYRHYKPDFELLGYSSELPGQ